MSTPGLKALSGFSRDSKRLSSLPGEYPLVAEELRVMQQLAEEKAAPC